MAFVIIIHFTLSLTNLLLVESYGKWISATVGALSTGMASASSSLVPHSCGVFTSCDSRRSLAASATIH